MGEFVDELRQRFTYWWRWVGPRRVAAAMATVIVGGVVAWWLLRAPVTPTEAQLPLAAGAAVSTTTTDSSTAPPSTSPPTTEPAVIVVHVTGAVQRPGVYRLPVGNRVVDGIAAAGGPLDDADPNALNLAAPLADGDRVAVPRVGESLPTPTGVTPADLADTPTADEPIDVNSASVEELITLPGVGPATAAAIAEHRQTNGPFASVDDLDDVSGIGPATLEQLRPLVTV